MKNITSSPRTWFTHSINGLLVLSLMLLGSGCRTDQSQHASIGFRNWVPRTHRNLARQHNRAQEQKTQAAGNETVTDQPLTTTVNAIAPNPPQLADTDMPLAPMPQEDIADLVAIENDLPALETTPEQSADAQEEPLAEVASEPTTAPLAPEPTDPLANTDTAQQEPATEPATDTDASDEAALEADVDETPLPLETEPLDTEIATPAPADSTATPLPMPQLPSEADMKVAKEILTEFKQLKEAGDLHHFSIYLRVLGGTAELSGELISEAQHDLLVRTTRTVAGVEEVKDLLVIKDANQEEAPEAAVEQALPPIPVAEAETAEPALPLEAALEPALEAATETTPAAAEAVDPVELVEETAAAEEAPVQEQEVTETPEPAAAVDEKPASDEPVVIPDPVEEELLQIK